MTCHKIKHQVALIIYNPQGHPIFQRRDDGANREDKSISMLDPHKLSFWGGAMEEEDIVVCAGTTYPDWRQSRLNAVVREAKEELGIITTHTDWTFHASVNTDTNMIHHLYVYNKPMIEGTTFQVLEGAGAEIYPPDQLHEMLRCFEFTSVSACAIRQEWGLFQPASLLKYITDKAA